MLGQDQQQSGTTWKQRWKSFFTDIGETAMNALGKVAGDKLANAIGAPEESPIAQAARQQERAAAAATRPSPVASAAKSAWPIIAVAGAGLAALGTVLVLKRKGR